MEHLFFKDGKYDAIGGFLYTSTDMKLIFSRLKKDGLKPVGIKINDGDTTIEILIEKTEEAIKKYNWEGIVIYEHQSAIIQPQNDN